MENSNSYIFKAIELIKANHEKQLLIAENKKQNLYLDYPKLKQFDKQIADVFNVTMKKIVSGEKPDFKDAEQKSLEIQKAKQDFIKANNINLDDIKPDFDCEKCEDTGYVNGKICDCVKKKAVALIYDELNKDVTLEDYTFEKFSLSYYPDKNIDGINPRDIMTKICGFCVKYVDKFCKDSESILFFGKTGLGKTHLSLAIANDVIKKGYNVVYGPISKIIGNIEKEHFSSGDDRVTLQNVLDCDLLILDDLGTEFTTQFVSASLFDIVNSRILNKKPTIINTNLDFEELKQRYTDRLVSRISGNYRMLEFFGEDIRTLK